MDGFTNFTATAADLDQHSLAQKIGCTGIGLHSGAKVSLTLNPAPAGHGIVFRRSDLGVSWPARYDHVHDTRFCTVLGEGDARIGTIEHVMAALAAYGIDNALIEVDGPEMPVFDGSAAAFAFLIGCAGTMAQNTPRRVIEILKTIRVTEGEAFVEFRPHSAGPVSALPRAVLDMAVSIEFAAAAIGRQALSLSLSAASFHNELEDARTFAQLAEIEALRAAGLAKGGSLDNAIVVDGGKIMNPAGLRRKDEFVRHKMLDAVGDLALAGGAIHGRFIAHRTGHALNNKLLRALFADAEASCVTSLAVPNASWFAQAAD
jgi:UDP-3-O-[3-hydroxymyristoyl] N-acetylglucosamine deacetylase